MTDAQREVIKAGNIDAIEAWANDPNIPIGELVEMSRAALVKTVARVRELEDEERLLKTRVVDKFADYCIERNESFKSGMTEDAKAVAREIDDLAVRIINRCGDAITDRAALSTARMFRNCLRIKFPDAFAPEPVQPTKRDEHPTADEFLRNKKDWE